MQRVGHLCELVASYDNLLRAARLAKRGCGQTVAACRFFFYLEPELLRLQAELRTGSYQPDRHRYFRIQDPKERMIAVAPFRDRVVHHAIVRVLTPIYEPCFIFDSYATRPGKGTHAAIRRAQQFLRRWPFYLKADVAKYFDSVDHEILLDILRRKIKDCSLLAILERIIRNTATPGQGLPIGNLTSQFLANVYLDPFDHALKDQMGVKGYLRYMDDFVVFASSKNELLRLRPQLERDLAERFRLSLNAPATFLNRASHGLSFLGMRIFPGVIRVKPENRRRSLRRIQRRVNAWDNGTLAEDAVAQSVASVAGHLRYFCPDARVIKETAAE